MYHFFVQDEQVFEDHVTILGNDVNHIKNVLRMKQGEMLQVTDSGAKVYTCRIAELRTEEILLEVLEKADGENELPSEIVLFQGIPKSDKMELIIQKAVELGVSSVIPTEMKRCVAKIEPKKEEARLKRWNAIAESAAKQSGRNRIPEIGPVMKLKEAVEYVSSFDHILVPYECADNMAETKAILEAIRPGESAAVFIGPEGGFEEKEVQEILAAGGKAITLGKRILRTETAGMNLLSVLGYLLG